MEHLSTSERDGPGGPRRGWVPPTCLELPPLEQLTLQTSGIIGDCNDVTGCSFSTAPSVRDDPQPLL